MIELDGSVLVVKLVVVNPRGTTLFAEWGRSPGSDVVGVSPWLLRHLYASLREKTLLLVVGDRPTTVVGHLGVGNRLVLRSVASGSSSFASSS